VTPQKLRATIGRTFASQAALRKARFSMNEPAAAYKGSVGISILDSRGRIFSHFEMRSRDGRLWRSTCGALVADASGVRVCFGGGAVTFDIPEYAGATESLAAPGQFVTLAAPDAADDFAAGLELDDTPSADPQEIAETLPSIEGAAE